MIKNISLPAVKSDILSKTVILPFNGKYITEKGFSFSFSCFDRTHELFNLGSKSKDGVISGKWFLDLLDCFKNVNNMTVQEVRRSMHDLHPVDWERANANPPIDGEQQEYWQFRINKSRGRVIGLLIDGIFYVVWLDPYHNLTDSDGYGTAQYYKAGISEYELLKIHIQKLEMENTLLREDLKAAEELLN